MEKTALQRFKETIQSPYLLERPSDIFYLTKVELSKGRLLVAPDQAVLFVDGRYLEKAGRVALCDVEPLENFSKIKEERIFFDSSYLSYDAFLSLDPKFEWVPFSNPLKKQRAIKSAEEIEALKKAAQLTLLGIEHLKGLLKVGVREEELKFAFETFVRLKGAERLSFEPIIAFGENGAYPHHRAGKTELQENQMVLVDAGASLNHYRGDLTRVFHFHTPPFEILKLERIVQNALEAALSMVRPGIEAGTLDKKVREIFDKEDVKQLYTHSLGHGIGLETHEFPLIRETDKTILEEGMVFTIEPGLYLPGVGGVRIEEMVLVTSSGGSVFRQ